MSKIIWIFLNLFFIEEYQFRGILYVFDIFWKLTLFTKIMLIFRSLDLERMLTWQFLFMKKCYLSHLMEKLLKKNLKCYLMVRGHSQTTLTKFCTFLTTMTTYRLTPRWNFWRSSFTVIKENLHIVDISRTTYLPCFVNIVCERPLMIFKSRTNTHWPIKIWGWEIFGGIS